MELRTINEFPNYKISVCGTVFSRFGREVKSHVDRYGYHQIQLYKNKKRHTCKIHRLLAQTFLPNFYGKLNVNHKNKNRSDNRLINLKWGTRRDNKSTPTNHKNIYCIKTKSVALYGIDTDLYTYHLGRTFYRFRNKTHSKTFETLEEAINYSLLI